jgi:copper chaperone CopZ
MDSTYTAIIHLRQPPRPRRWSALAPALRLVRGVERVTFEPADCLITVRFDDSVTSLADLVRQIEDRGSAVSSVAQRPDQRGRKLPV